MNDRLETLVMHYQNVLNAFGLVLREKKQLPAFGNSTATFENGIFAMRMLIDRGEPFVSLSRLDRSQWLSLSYLLALLQPALPLVGEASAAERMLSAQDRINEFFSSPHYDCLVTAYNQLERSLNRCSVRR